MDLLPWCLVLAALLGMGIGLVRPPERDGGLWLLIFYVLAAAGFIWMDGSGLAVGLGLALALFSGAGAWLGFGLTRRQSSRVRFRAGALGWFCGVGFTIWWLWD